MSSRNLVINNIFIMVCEEASKRPGMDLVKNLNNVMLEVNSLVIEFMAYIREQERKEPNNGG